MTKSKSADGAIIGAAATPNQPTERKDPKPRKKRNSSPGSVFAYRGRWLPAWRESNDAFRQFAQSLEGMNFIPLKDRHAEPASA